MSTVTNYSDIPNLKNDFNMKLYNKKLSADWTALRMVSTGALG